MRKPWLQMLQVLLSCIALTSGLRQLAAQTVDRALVEAARKEGEVNIWGQAGAERRAFIKEAFERAYPGIRVNYFQASTSSDRDVRFIQEMKAGVVKVDLLHGGSVSAAVNVKPLGLLQPLRPYLDPALLESGNWRNNQQVWVDPQRAYFLIGDLQVYPAAAVPASIGRSGLKSWEELLDAKYDGKIIMRDPRSSGNGFTTMLFLNYNKNLGLEYLRKFFAHGRIVFSNDERQNVEWIDSGRMLVSIYPRTQEVDALQAVGSSIAAIPALTSKGELISSVSSTDGIIFLPKIDPLPHPNAAKLYINWFYSKAGQQAMVDALTTNTYRTDVDTSRLPASIKPLDGVTYLNMNDEAFADPAAIKTIRDAVVEALKP